MITALNYFYDNSFDFTLNNFFFYAGVVIDNHEQNLGVKRKYALLSPIHLQGALRTLICNIVLW